MRRKRQWRRKSPKHSFKRSRLQDTLRKETDTTVRLLIEETIQQSGTNATTATSVLDPPTAQDYSQMMLAFKEIHEQALEVLAKGKGKDAQIA